MTGYDPEYADQPDYDDAELDELLATGMDMMLAKLETRFPPEEGLADIYARLAAIDPPPPASTRVIRHREPAPSIDNQRLQEVCDQIDTLDACLAAVIRTAQNAPFAGGAFVEAARPVLMQLRLGLANRVLAREEAERILGFVRHNLDETDRILRTQQTSLLDQVIHARLRSHAEFGGPVTEQTRLLAEMITRLYEDVGYVASLEPAR